MKSTPGTPKLHGAVADFAHDCARDLGLHGKRAEHLMPLLAASDFAQRALLAHPEWIAPLLRRAVLPVSEDLPFAHRLAIQQRAAALTVIARDVLDGISPADVGVAMSELASAQIDHALHQAAHDFAARRPFDAEHWRLCVFGMGKLGGGELNFSSDLDLVMAYGPPNDANDELAEWQEVAARITRRTAQYLSEATPDGQAWRIDLRLRPFGQAGQLALPFDAMEQYFQREGRDWERYAWIKASPVAGDLVGGRSFLATLRPFIYRRYLDYAAFEGLREMKRLIDAEVDRRGLESNLKLGPGGIREIEFMVQLEQLIRGGRVPSLRASGTLTAMTALADAQLWPSEKLEQLRLCYNHLRRIENRAQMFDNQQTHELPNDSLARERIAQCAGYQDAAALDRALTVTRDTVQSWFQIAVLPTQHARVASAAGGDKLAVTAGSDLESQGAEAQARAVWQSLQDADAPRSVPSGVSTTLWDKLKDFVDSPQVRSLSARSRARLDHVVPMLWALTRSCDEPNDTAERVLEFLQAVLRRSAYLALLVEQPASARWLVRLFAASPWAAQRICQTPILLDELIDGRLLTEAITPEGLQRAWRLQHPTHAAWESLAAGESEAGTSSAAGPEQPDAEQTIEALRQFQQATMLRLAVQLLFARADAIAVARSLAWVADFVLQRSLVVALTEMHAQHGALPGLAPGTALCSPQCCGFAVIGYGSLGGRELNFASDLDLVFLYDEARAEQESDGRRPLDGHRYFVRLAQRLLHLLTFATASGPMYAVDTRLRPDGGKGLLVSAMDRFERYQLTEAWNWEHHALVRARWVAGDRTLSEAFSQVRRHVVAQARDPAALAEESHTMRQRMRRELDRSNELSFDLKQGAGGLVDIEFALQRLALSGQGLDSGATGSNDATDTPSWIERWPDRNQSLTLAKAHHRWLSLGLAATLAGRKRVMPLSPEDQALAREVVNLLG